MFEKKQLLLQSWSRAEESELLGEVDFTAKMRIQNVVPLAPISSLIY